MFIRLYIQYKSGLWTFKKSIISEISETNILHPYIFILVLKIL